MGYYSWTPTGPDDLLDKIRLALITEGWTVNLWADDNSTYYSWTGLVGTGKRLHVQKVAAGGPTMYFNFRSVNRGVIFSGSYSSSQQYGGKYYSEVTGLGLNGSTGYDVGEEWDDQPGHQTNSSAQTCGAVITELSLTAIPAAYLFCDGDTCVLCVEYQSGKFQWLAWGCLEKNGTYTGGQFFFGSLGFYWPSYQLLYGSTTQTMFLCKYVESYSNGGVYLDVDSQPGWRGPGTNTLFPSYLEMPGTAPNDSSPSHTYFNTLVTHWMTRSPNFYNAVAPLAPAYILCLRASANYCLLGQLKSLRIINPQYYDPGASLTLGSDTWRIFPGHSKADADARMGIACKQVT